MSASSSLLPDGRRGRFLAVAMTGLAVATLWLLIVSPLLDRFLANREAVADHRMTLAHMEAIRDGLPALKQRLQDREAAAGQETLFLPASSDAMGTAELQQLVSALVAQTGCTVSAQEAVPAHEAGHLRQVGVRLNLTASWPDFIAFLTALEHSDPRLFADELHIRGLDDNDHTKADNVDVSLVVTGFWSVLRKDNTPAVHAADSPQSAPS